MNISIKAENYILEKKLRNPRLIELCLRGIPPQYDRDVVYNHLLKEILEPDKGISKRLRKYINLKGKRVLEVGCGSGLDCLDLAEEGAHMTGLEISEGRLEFGRELMKEKNINFMLVKGDACAPPFSNDEFDVVVCRHLIEHLPEPDKKISSFIDLLSGEGILYIDFPNKYNIRQILSDDHYKLPFIALLPRSLAKFIVTKMFRYEKQYSTNVFLSPWFFQKVMNKLNRKYVYISPDIEQLAHKMRNPGQINNMFLRRVMFLVKLFHLNHLCIWLIQNKFLQSIMFPNFVAIVFNKSSKNQGQDN